MAIDPGTATGITAIIIGAFGILKYWPMISSNLSNTIASNRASTNTIEVLQEMVASERAGRIAAEKELREMVKEWAEMKSKFDMINSQLDTALKNGAKQELINDQLKSQIDTLSKQLREANI